MLGCKGLKTSCNQFYVCRPIKKGPKKKQEVKEVKRVEKNEQDS